MDPVTLGFALFMALVWAGKETGKWIAESYRSAGKSARARNKRMRESDNAGDNLLGWCMDAAGTVIQGTVGAARGIGGAIERGGRAGWQEGRKRAERHREARVSSGDTRPWWRRLLDALRGSRPEQQGDQQDPPQDPPGPDGDNGPDTPPPGPDTPDSGEPPSGPRCAGGCGTPMEGEGMLCRACATRRVPLPPPPPGQPERPAAQSGPKNCPHPPDRRVVNSYNGSVTCTACGFIWHTAAEQCAHPEAARIHDPTNAGIDFCTACNSAVACSGSHTSEQPDQQGDNMTAPTAAPSGEATCYTQAKDTVSQYNGAAVRAGEDAVTLDRDIAKLQKAISRMIDDLTAAKIGDVTMTRLHSAKEQAAVVGRHVNDLGVGAEECQSAARETDQALTAHQGIYEAYVANADDGDREFHGGAAETKN